MIKRKFLAILLSFLLIGERPAHALFGVGDVVFDPAAFAEMLNQTTHMIATIKQLKSSNKWLDQLNEWEILDHTNLAGDKFFEFLTEYKKQFEDVMEQIEAYQNGGIMGAIGDLESRYPGYHEDWDLQDKAGDILYENFPELAGKMKTMKKQILLTKIQMKHAVLVGAKVRESLKVASQQTSTLLDDTAQAVGVMQSIKIGNELTGMVSQSLQTLNVQMNEFIQAYSAAELEKNQAKGEMANRLRDALKDFGVRKTKEKPLPNLNPIGAFNG